MNLTILKLVTGEEVLGEIESQSETHFVLLNPVGISIVRGPDGQPNVGFTPYPLHAEQKKGTILSIDRKFVVLNYEPAEDFKSNYNQIFGSGIITPPKQIITG